MRSRTIKLFVYLTIMGTLMYFAVNRTQKQNFTKPHLITPVVQTTLTPLAPRLSPVIGDDLQSTVEEALEGTRGTYGVVIKNLKTGENYFTNEHKEFQPGSLYKIWIMATAFNQIQNGELNENEILSEDVKTLNDEFSIDQESAELTEGTITLSVKNALEQMITISHNYAALLLSKRIKLSNVKNFLNEHGFDESTLGEPLITTPYDIALFFEKLYKGELGDQENTQKMIDILKRQTFNDKIPKYLLKEIPIAHKTGEIDFLTHDAGIVFSGKGDYIIIIFSESDFPPGAEERIAEVSQAVYKYFEKD